jgi:SAM-dependent methyltransferase
VGVFLVAVTAGVYSGLRVFRESGIGVQDNRGAQSEDSTNQHFMKLRDSGMPEENYWETLLDVPLILDRLQLSSEFRDAIEVGCGYGTFSLPIARRITGTLRAYDIDPAMVERTAARASDEGILNVQSELRDVIAEGFGVGDDSQDAVFLFNLLHCEDPVALLLEASRTLRSGGRCLVIHWRHDPRTPRGPDLSIRPKPSQIVDWAEAADLVSQLVDPLDLPPWHFGIILGKAWVDGLKPVEHE